MLDPLQLQMCDTQGKLFVLSAEKGYSSELFIRSYMNSETVAYIDHPYNSYQWAGASYVLHAVVDEKQLADDRKESYPTDVLFWIGYLYRYWHFTTGETSKQIYRQASAKTMRQNYLMFHTMTPELAIAELKELYQQKHSG